MEKLLIIQHKSELAPLLKYLEDKTLVAWDTETNGLGKDAKVIGLSVSAEVNVGYYLILAYWDVPTSNLVYTELYSEMKAFCEVLKTKDLIAHNAIFDCAQIEQNFGVSLMPSIHTDTMILAHLLNENRHCGLKELGVIFYGESAKEEQVLMKESVTKNGGQLTRDCYELYKADKELLAKYGAKDAILTYKLFLELVPTLYEEGLDTFFYEEESMPLLRGPTYQLNTTGLRVDPETLQNLKGSLEVEILEAQAYVNKEVKALVKGPFNINAPKQLGTLLYGTLSNDFNLLTPVGKALCRYFQLPLPYALKDKRAFIKACEDRKDEVWVPAGFNSKTKKKTREKKVGSPWDYTQCGAEMLRKLSNKYKWCAKLLEFKKATKMLGTYVEGIKERLRYNIIQPSFLQHGTTSGRYSCKQPNFQNLPREDKRVRSCVVARPGKVFVGADYSQLEPRVFASISGDETLCACFASGEDFYSVVGAPIFEKYDCSLVKDDKNSFAKKYPQLRDKSKVIALATPYGRTASQQAQVMDISRDESQELINKYFETYPKVHQMMLGLHAEVKEKGVVYNLFGRPRRIPGALEINDIFGDVTHAELPYEIRTMLNLAVNHRIQSTGASIMNRAAIAFCSMVTTIAESDPRWNEVKLALQIHDELVIEAPEALGEDVAIILKEAMENTVTLPGVALLAEPKIAKSLDALK
jgi:DNA polymerase-1